MPIPVPFADRVCLPLIAAPMFLVSGPELVIEACQSGVIGAFPTANCRSVEQLDEWFTQIDQRLADFRSSHPAQPVAPPCANLIVHRSNPRLQDDLSLVRKHRIELVIASVGSPHAIIEPIHDYGGLVYADVASMRHVEKALAAGSDGLDPAHRGCRRPDRLGQSLRLCAPGPGGVRRPDCVGRRGS